MFEDFDFSVLDEPSFKEDAVREEIIAPILRRLGYRPTGTMRVERSKTLVHPFVMIGSKQHKVNIIPDYTLYNAERPIMILDAKAPTEEILQSRHVEQAYSYAIHPGVRCDHYALCNGRQLVIFDIRRWEPIFSINIAFIDEYWEEVEKYLLPRYLQMPELREFAPDFGLHVKKAGIEPNLIMEFPGYYLQNIMRVSDDLFTSPAGCEVNGREYLISFDYDGEILAKILAEVPAVEVAGVRAALSKRPYCVILDGMIRLRCYAHLGELAQGEHEYFVPFVVTQVIAADFDPSVQLKDNPNETHGPPFGAFRLTPGPQADG